MNAITQQEDRALTDEELDAVSAGLLLDPTIGGNYPNEKSIIWDFLGGFWSTCGCYNGY